MEDKNLGVLIASPRPKDYIFGSSSNIVIDRKINNWSIYLPPFESQRNKITDFLDCVTMSMIHHIEMELNYLMASNQLIDEALYFFHNNGYINNGSFQLSARFNAKLNGTDITKGQYLNVAGDCLRRDGFIPKSDWDISDSMSDTLYYIDIPIGLFAKAKKALWFIDVKYQWVNKSDFPFVLQTSPIQVATEICSGWDSGSVVNKCSGQPLQHATIIYGIDGLGNYEDLDHYPPYLQTLASDFEFPVNMQYVVTPKPIMLRNGMYGSNVLQLQKDLNTLGFFLAEDSSFGNKTQTQVISFQNKTGLKPDGIAGPLTLAKLKELTDTTLKDSIKDIIKDTCLLEGIDPELGIAVASCEGGLVNAKITRKNTNGSIDRGIFQWNDREHPEISDEQAFDPKQATIAFCKAVLTGHLGWWYLSQPNWSKLVPVDVLKKYNIK